MAIYNFHGTVISRSQGKSVIAAAAYRSGERLYDERQERFMNYTRKQDILHKEILLPQGAPEWMLDRTKLWNTVEAMETRKDSQLAREFNFALPREFSKEQSIECAREFVQNQFVSRGMVADLCIHEGKTLSGTQPHAHIMLTMREVTEEGFGLKNRSWNAKENIMLWREAWAEHLNKYLALNGIDQKVDHRSLTDRGINLIPQVKIGAKNLEDHKRRLEEYHKIAQINGEKLLKEPEIALKAITHHQSTFTSNDICRFANAHTADITQFQVVVEKIKASEQIVYLGKDEKGEDRFTTKEMLTLEKNMLQDVESLQKQKQQDLSSAVVTIATMSDVVDEKSIESTADIQSSSDNKDQSSDNSAEGSEQVPQINEPQDPIELEPGTTTSTSTAVTLSTQQQHALEHITTPGGIKCLIGYAGTGKSILLKEAKVFWEQQGYQVVGATLSGIAAENLEGASGISSRTFASRCYYWDSGRGLLTPKDILVIDEAGMLGTRQLARAAEEVNARGAKLVLLGDPNQLQAIEAGAAFRAISTKTSYLELTEIKRQQEIWQQEATREFALRDVKKAFERYDRHGHIHSFATQEIAKNSLVTMWNESRMSQPEKTQIMLAYTRRDAKELNEIAREYRKQNNELGEDNKLQTSDGPKNFAVGDKIYFLRNNRDLGVMNGTLGNIEDITDSRLKIVVAGEGFKDQAEASTRIVNIELGQYNHITHGYAATIHKAQGLTVDKSYILASQHLDSHATYVGMSRHRESVDLFWSKEEFSDGQALLYTLGRDRSKDVALDYLQAPDKILKNEALALENSLESRLNRIITECTNLTNSIHYCETQQEKFKQEGTFSLFLQETKKENIASIKQILKGNQSIDLELLQAFKEQEPRLFNDIDKACKNILTDTTKSLESQEVLRELTRDNPRLYEQVLATELNCRKLFYEYEQAKEDVLKIFTKTGDLSSLKEHRRVRDESQNLLEQYIGEMCKNTEELNLIKQHDPKLFDDINKNFDDVFSKTIQREGVQRDVHNEYMKSFAGEISREERVNATYEQYKELKQEYLDAQKEVIEVFTVTGELSSLDELRETRDEAKEALDQYANEACKDKDFMDYLAANDAKEFNEMNERFNELMEDQTKELQKELEKDILL